MLSTWLSTFQGVLDMDKCYKSVYKKLLPNNYNPLHEYPHPAHVNLSRRKE